MRYDDTVILIELFLLPTIPLFRLLSRDTWIHKKQRHSAFKIWLDRMFIYWKSNADIVSKYSATNIAISHYRYKEETMVIVLYFSGLFIYSYKIYIHPSNFALAIFNKYFFFQYIQYYISLFAFFGGLYKTTCIICDTFFY